MEISQTKQKKTYIGISLMTLAALFTTFGQLFWKLSHASLNIELIIGFALYFLGAITMIIAFRFGKLSILHPLLSIGYIFSTILGTVFLNEQLRLTSILGIVLIMIGVILIGGESD